MMSINSSFERNNFRQLGGYMHGTYKQVTPAQKEKIINHSYIKEYGERMVLGIIADSSFRNQSAEISFMDDNTAEWSFIELEEGHMPAQKNEVVMDKEALRLLGYEPVIGENVELTFALIGDADENNKYTDTFTLAGFWEFDFISPAHYINVSKEYAEEFSRTIEKQGHKPLTTDIKVMLSSAVNVLDRMSEVFEDDTGSEGISADDSIKIGINPGYTVSNINNDEMLETAIPLSALLLLVIFAGYLIIYNIFHISVVNDIRFYGLLKAIGTTQRQVKRIIRLQALALCIVGIPIGLLLGYLLGSVLMPFIIETTNVSQNSLSISTSPIIFVAAAIFEIITVLISVSKPGRMAGKASPIEALRFNDGMDGRKTKRSTRGARVTQMAFANTGRNKRKTILVFISLALSLVILNTVNMFVGGLDTEKWLDKSMSVDFVVGKYPYFKYHGIGQISISEDEIDLIKENTDSAKGGTAYEIKNCPLINVSEEEYRAYQAQGGMTIEIVGKDGSFYMPYLMEGMDDHLIDKLNVYEGDASLLKDRNNRYIALLANNVNNGEYIPDENAPKIGDKITIAAATTIEYIDKRTGEPATYLTYDHPEFLAGTYSDLNKYEYTLCAYVDVPSDISLRRTAIGYNAIACSDNLKEDFKDNLAPVFYAFDTELPDAEEKAESYLQKLSEVNTGITYDSKAVKRSEFNDFKNLFTLLGGVLCMIIGFVGVLNFYNTVVAGIIARKNEIAVLQAIGMTGKQVKEMLMIEGMIYTLGSGLLALILSILFIPAVNGVANNIFDMYSAHFSITPILIFIPIMILLGVSVPLMSYKGLSKASVVERIREIG